MNAFYDQSETQATEAREAELFSRLGKHLVQAVEGSPGLARHLAGIDGAKVNSREALARLPVLRKDALMEAQAAHPPFGGFANLAALHGSRLFLSPGPVWEPQGLGADPWGSARALFALGCRAGSVVHNAISYHMTPGGFILDEGARALGCTVFPGGIGNTEQQVEAAAALRPDTYTGTPDYLKVMLDKADEMGADLSSIKRALVSGGALFPAMRTDYARRGVQVLQAYATADLGFIAYETMNDEVVCDGMVVNENLIVEIVRPGTGDPVAVGEVGELVVTNFSQAYPLVRFGTGDLSAILPGVSPCGRTNMRIRGWMGRADQRTKVKGMFVDPKQIARIVNAHDSILAARLVVSRKNDQDDMVLQVTKTGKDLVDAAAIAATMRDITKLRGEVVVAHRLPNDGKVIADERRYD